jgi:hypothetical protein
LTLGSFDGKVKWVGGSVKQVDKNRSTSPRAANLVDEEKVIPWAEGNGLWSKISGLATDLAAVDVITFFAQNPYTCDSAESVAVRIGRDVAPVDAVLRAMAKAGFLDATEMAGLCVYNLTDASDRRQTLQQYVAWLRESYHWGRLVLDNTTQSEGI